MRLKNNQLDFDSFCSKPLKNTEIYLVLKSGVNGLAVKQTVWELKPETVKEGMNAHRVEV